MDDAIGGAEGIPLSGNARLPDFIDDLDPEQNGHYPDTVNGQDAHIPDPGKRAGSRPVPAPARPVIAMDAAESLNLATPKSAALFAGETLHWVSREDAHLAAGRAFSLATAGSTGIHAAKGGVKTIAQHGKVVYHAHQGKETWSARQEMTVISGEQEIRLYAQKKITLNGDRTAIELDGQNITLYMPEDMDIKAASKRNTVAGGKAAVLPVLPKGEFGKEVYTGRYQLFKDDNRPFEGYRYRIMDMKGKVLKEGITDKDGFTDSVYTENPEEIQAFKFVMRESERITENWEARLDAAAQKAEGNMTVKGEQ
jgi:type VI secretion system secreted protein VgrG